MAPAGTVQQPEKPGRLGASRLTIVVTAAIGLAVVVVLGLIWLIPTGGSGGSGNTRGQSGVDQFGSATGLDGTGNRPSPGTSAGSANPTTGVPSAGAGAGAGAGGGGVGGADVRATYRVNAGAVNTTVGVTITNQGTAAADGWTVVMKLSGVPVRVIPGPGISYHGGNGELTFTPPEGQVIAPGDIVGFTYTVTGLLGGKVQSCTINGRPCTAG